MMKYNYENNEVIDMVKALPMLIFRKPGTADIEILKKYFDYSKLRSCDYSVAGVLLWQEYFNYEIAEYHHTIFIKGTLPNSSVTLFYKPVGELDTDDSLQLIREYAETFGLNARLVTPHAIDIDEANLDILFPIDEPVEAGWTEYMYDIHKFIGYPGKKMEKKRNHLNYFLHHYSDFDVYPIDNSNLKEVSDFTMQFAASHADADIALYESRQILNMLTHFSRYGMIGIVVKYDGKIVGYSFGEIVGDTLFAHVEKGDINYRGIYQLLAYKLCERALELSPELKYVNREDDMGSPHLRKSKFSYHPDILIIKSLDEIG